MAEVVALVTSSLKVRVAAPPMVDGAARLALVAWAAPASVTVSVTESEDTEVESSATSMLTEVLLAAST